MAWRKPKNISEWMGLVLRNKKKLFFSSVVVALGIVVGSFWIARQYSAQAIFQRRNDAALRQMGNTTIRNNLSQIRLEMREAIMGRTAIEQLIRDEGLDADFPHTPDNELTPEGEMMRQVLIREIRANTSFRYQVRNDSLDQVAVTYSGTDRELVSRIANRLVENYIRRTREELDQMLLTARDFFESQVAVYRENTNTLETALLRFEMDHHQQGVDRPESLDRGAETVDDGVVSWHEGEDVGLDRDSGGQRSRAQPGRESEDHHRPGEAPADPNKEERKLPRKQPPAHVGSSMRTRRFCQK